MVYGITKECTCCREIIQHCKKCWNKHHHGIEHKDYILPTHYGQVLMEETEKIMKEKYNIDLNETRTILSNKKRPYKEGEYH